MKKEFHFKGLLTEKGWLANVLVTTENGKITAIKENATVTGEVVNGYALPGFQNAHSHAFQYAMAGIAEYYEGNTVPDDFWSWRTAMYELALTLSPEQIEHIATQLYAEMARHGYTAVTEFHYLHHQPNGKPYQNPAEIGQHLVNAAKNAGIHITLVPMFYQMGGFGTKPTEKQRRFISPALDSYYQLVEATQNVCKTYDRALCGIGVHSLRAAKENDIIELTNNLNSDTPFHIHVAEQLKEIEDCLAFYGKRPVEWLLDKVKLADNYHLVHATHLNNNEVIGIAKSGAHVVLCPTTEGNLGDGLFKLHDFKKYGGNWSIGTDSHIGINPLEELRMLDYGQRVTSHKRTSFWQTAKGDVGFNALKMWWQSGRKAMGLSNNSFFEIGQPFDAAIVDATTPLMSTTTFKNLCNTIVYTQDASAILGTISNGKWIVKNGKHLNHQNIVSNFTTTIKKVSDFR